ncbi:MAG TPA: hypothetical protein VL225_10620 [Vicinamibacterales bacterium]|jgi:hypothetical protein|nr:hypothetical protein [Vicinamibacterales bacterium]
MQETKRALIVVRTYPTPAKKGIEVSCTAAITAAGEWLRLFPVPYRFLDKEQRFRKYQWVDARVEKASDARPESFKLIYPDPIRVVSETLPTDNRWLERRRIVDPLKGHCLCCLQKQRRERGSPTLGIFKPRRITRLLIEQDAATWTDEQLQILRQQHLFRDAPSEELEKVPFKFKYEFMCNHDECVGHTLICTDWEMGQSWRSWRDMYSEQWQEKFRQRYEQEMIGKYDTHFYVGTVHQHPDAWIIVGLFYPPKPQMDSLFSE